MRKLLVVVVVLALLLLAADRIGVLVASRALAANLRTSAALPSDPTVSINGFPFLTQAIAGRYERIEVRTGALTRGGVRLAHLDVALTGVRVPLSQAISGSVTAVPVDALTATAVVTYADVASVGTLAGISVTPAGSGVHVTGRLTVLGQTFQASTESTVRLDGRSIVITARKLTVLGQSSALVNSALAGRLDLRVPVGTLPYGLKLSGVHTSSEGLMLEAATGPTVLRAQAN